MLQKYAVFFLLLLFVGCTDGENPVQFDPDQPEAVPVEPVDITLPEALFTDAVIVADGKQSKVILNRLVELIDAVPEDGSIYVSIYLFEYEPLLQALERAHTRNVSLHVMMDRSDRSDNTATANKLDELDGSVEIVWIYNNASGIAINHNKFVLLPEVSTSEGTLENVIFQTSQNFKESGNRKIQDGVILSDADLYDAYLDYWQDMKSLANDQMADFEYREYEDPDTGVKAYFYPKRRDGLPYEGDTIIELLNGIDDPSSATVKIGMSAWSDSRGEILSTLENLISEGLNLEVVTKSSIGDETYDRLVSLADSGATIRIYNMSKSGPQKVNIHSKFMMIDGTWNGEQTQLLLTGSQNFTMNALYNNNEVSLLFRDHEFYTDYETYFEELKIVPVVCCSKESAAKILTR